MNETTKLRVWWIPQIPMTAFRQEVNSLVEARLLLDTLAQYDLFQLENNVKPDYANAGGLEYYDEGMGEWSEWYDESMGEDIDYFTLDELRQHEKDAAQP